MQISQREKLFLMGGGVSLLVLGIFYLFFQFNLKLKNIEAKKMDSLNDKNKLQQLSIEYQQLKSISKEIKASNLGLDLTAEMENLLSTSNLPGNKFFLKPYRKEIEKQYIKDEVRITLPEVTAKDLLTIIQSVENNPQALLNIDYFQVRPLKKKEGYYTASLTVVSYKNK